MLLGAWDACSHVLLPLAVILGDFFPQQCPIPEDTSFLLTKAKCVGPCSWSVSLRPYVPV